MDIGWVQGERDGKGESRALDAGMVIEGSSYHVPGWITKDACLTVSFPRMSWVGNCQLDGVVLRDLLVIKHPVYAVACVCAHAFDLHGFSHFSSTRSWRV